MKRDSLLIVAAAAVAAFVAWNTYTQAARARRLADLERRQGIVSKYVEP